jgi:hypothetical protein
MPPIFGKPSRPTPKPVLKIAGTPPQMPPSLWREVNIDIPLVNGTTIKRRAKVFGSIAVHLGVQYEDVYSITLTVSGLRVMVCGSDETPALQIAYTLQTLFPMALREPTNVEIIARLPPWVKLWIEACHTAQAWVDPTPYRETTNGPSI